MFLLLAACVPEAPVESSPPDTGTSACAEVPALRWDSYGHGFLIENCDGCHASGTADRHGAPEDATFDTVEEAWAWSERILARATGESPTMPPMGGVSDDDRQLLAWWLGCATPGT